MSLKGENQVLEHNKMQRGGKLPDQEGMQYAAGTTDDAFSTLMQWLYARIPHTRASSSAS